MTPGFEEQRHGAPGRLAAWLPGAKGKETCLGSWWGSRHCEGEVTHWISSEPWMYLSQSRTKEMHHISVLKNIEVWISKHSSFYFILFYFKCIFTFSFLNIDHFPHLSTEVPGTRGRKKDFFSGFFVVFLPRTGQRRLEGGGGGRSHVVLTFGMMV